MFDDLEKLKDFYFKLIDNGTLADRMLAKKVSDYIISISNGNLNDVEIRNAKYKLSQFLFNTFVHNIDKKSRDELNDTCILINALSYELETTYHNQWYVESKGLHKLVKDANGVISFDYTIPRTENGYEITPELECSLSEDKLKEAQEFLRVNVCMLTSIHNNIETRNRIFNGDYDLRSDNVNPDINDEISRFLGYTPSRDKTYSK